MVIPFLLLACESETGLGPVEPPRDEPAPAAPDPSPWDDPDAGALPDVAFLAVWDDVTGVSALNESNDQYPCRPGPTLWTDVLGDPAVDLVDVRGQVIGSFGFDRPITDWFDPILSPIDADRALMASAVGQEHTLWELDLQAITAEPIATWTPDDGLILDGVARSLGPYVVRVHSAAVADDLFVAVEAGVRLPLDQPLLYAFSRTEVAAPPVTWSGVDLLPAGFVEAAGDVWVAISGMTQTAGELVIQASVVGPPLDDPAGEVDYRLYEFVFLPDTGQRSWTLDISDQTLVSWEEPVHRHRPDGRAALFTEYAYLVEDPALRLFDTARAPRRIAPPESTCLNGLAILDPEAATVVYARHDPAGPDDYGSALVVNHRGDEVWRLDTLRRGLAERRAHVRSLLLLE